MKISNYHKNKGDEVILIKLKHNYYSKQKDQKIIDAKEYNKVYASLIFPINKDSFKIINCNDVLIGGTGENISKKLPVEIENEDFDYSIYPENDTSYGFITRGCIRNCSFCFVPKKEGMLYFNKSVKDIVKHKKVKFLDNNILAYNKHKEILQELIDKNIKCQFNQGLDIRLIDYENAKLLSKINYWGEYIFAFDNINLINIIETKLIILKKYISKDWKIKMFLYCNPAMKLKEDVIKRIEWCKQNKVLPYFMRDITCWDSKYREFYSDLAAWCNQPSIFKKMEFHQFIIKRTNNIERQKNSINIYNGVEQ